MTSSFYTSPRNAFQDHHHTYNNGYDILPEEERRMMVNVLIGESPDGIPVYQPHFLHREERTTSSSRSNTRHPIFFEPLDLSDDINDGDSSYSFSSPPARHAPSAASHDRTGSSGRNPEKENYNYNSNDDEYYSERERLKTFNWVWKSEVYNVSKEDLAREGFVYKGPGDLVMCVFCRKSIRKWDVGDSVAGEHKRIYPRCPWVCGKVDYNVPMSRTLDMERNMRISAKDQPRHTDMETPEARASSFQGWVKRTNVSVGGLVKAGFFYDNSTDIVTCYHCGVKVPGWDITRDLSGRHSHSSPDCPMVQQNTTDIINNNNNNNNSNNNSNNYNNNMSPTRPPTDIPLNLSPEDEGGSSVDPDRTDGQASIEEDMRSSAVQAIVDCFEDEYSLTDIRKAVASLRMTKGSGPITSEDILKELDPVLMEAQADD